MKPSPFRLVMMLGTLAIAGAMVPAQGDETNPYLSIVERNVFGLKDEPPPPPPPEPPAPPPVPIPAVKLTGITSILNKTKALFELTEPGPGKTPQKPILQEGERDGELEVISIDVEKSHVLIKIAGIQTNITFAPIESPKTPAAPAVAAGRPITLPNPTTAAAGGSEPILISRGDASSARGAVTLLGGGTPSPSPGIAPALGSAGASAATTGATPSFNASSTAAANRLRSIPSRTIRTPGENPAQNVPTMTKEQAYTIIEAQRMVNPRLPLPPTPYTQQLNPNPDNE